ncbi:MAG: ATP-binding protein [Thermoplasmatales archaeon]
MRKRKISSRDFIKVRRISPVNESNPFLISWLSSGREIEYLIIKRKDEKVRIYISKSSEDLMSHTGWYLGESVKLNERGRKLFIKGDPRYLEFGNVNYADRIVELLSQEVDGFVKIRIKHHYFPSYNTKKNGPSGKQKEKLGWRLDIEFYGERVGSYLKHIFSSRSVTAFTARLGFGRPVITLTEIPKFLPSSSPPDRTSGIAIGKTLNSGKIYIDFQRDPHVLIAGSSGSGKSTMIVGMMNSILESKKGKVILIDPHGDTARKMTEYNVAKFVISPESGTSINLIGSRREFTYRVSEEFVSILKSFRELQYSDPLVGPRMEDIISRGITILAKNNGMTLVDFYNILRDEKVRGDIITGFNDQDLISFVRELGSMTDEEKISTERAVGRLVNDPIIRSLICNPDDRGILSNALSSYDLLIFDLDRGVLGYEDSRILANIFALLIWFEISSSGNDNYFLFLEEANDYQSDLIADMMSSGRKFGLHVIFVTTSFLAISESVRPLLASNVPNYIFMRLTEPDKAKVREFVGMELHVPEEPLNFLYLSPDGIEKGVVDPVKFMRIERKFSSRSFNFITESVNNSIEKRLDEIFSTMEECTQTYFILEEFVRYFGEPNRKRVISKVKEIIAKDSRIRYVGRVNINNGLLKGRHECFVYNGIGNDCSRLLHEFKVTSDLLYTLIDRK